MQFLPVDTSTKLVDLGRVLGERNVTSVLAKNGYGREVNIGQAIHNKCEQVGQNSSINITNQRKVTWLNTLRGDADLFESASLQSESSWRVLDTLGTFDDTLYIPEDIKIVDSSTLIGNGQQVPNKIANEAITQMDLRGWIEPGIFQFYSTMPNVSEELVTGRNASTVFEQFHIPWGKVSLYSSMSNEYQDIPVYPKVLSDKAVATYDTMPDMLYQYEPWQVYRSSGPREISYEFDFHRDMWTGDHRDGFAMKLVQFCKANCYPRFSGSLVNTSFVTLYVGGHSVIHGILTSAEHELDGPIGLDNLPLHCVLRLTIVEVSKEPLNYDYVKNMKI